MKLLYPKRVSFFTKPEVGKQYSFRFTWEATEAISEGLIQDAFAIIEAHFKEKYPVRITWVMGKVPEGELGAEIAFVVLEPIDVSLGEMWNETRAFALEYYLDFGLKEITVWLPRFPWWILLLVATIGTGTAYAIAKRKKK